MRCYTSPGRTSLDGRLRGWGIIYIYFSLLFIFFQSTRLTRLPIHASCLSGHHAPSYNPDLSLCAAALTITSWVARPPGAHHKQQQAHATLLLNLLISRCFDLIEPASRPPCSVLMCFVLVVLYLTVQVGRVRGSNALSHPGISIHFLFSCSAAWDWAIALQL